MVVAADSANKAVESVDLSVSKALREDNMYLHAGIGRKGRGCFKLAVWLQRINCEWSRDVRVGDQTT